VKGYIMSTSFWICIAGAGVSLLYALYSLFMKKKSGDVSLDSALRKVSGRRGKGMRQVKESSRILKPQPDTKTPTVGDEESTVSTPGMEEAAEQIPEEIEESVSEPMPAEAPQEAVEEEAAEGVSEPESPEMPVYEESVEEQAADQQQDYWQGAFGSTDQAQEEQTPETPEEAETAEPAEQETPDQEAQNFGGFIQGLDEDIKSDYHERQSLESEAIERDKTPLQEENVAARDETPVQESEAQFEDSPEDEVFNVASEFQEGSPAEPDYYGAEGAPGGAFIESDDIAESQEPGDDQDFMEVSDTQGEKNETEWLDREESDGEQSSPEDSEEAGDKPTSRDISQAFHRLESDKEEEEKEEAEEDENREDDTLFK
jgi:hypothetical protein